MAMLNLVEGDCAWVTERIKEAAARTAGGRIVSVLEGGYALHALGRSVATLLGVLGGLERPREFDVKFNRLIIKPKFDRSRRLAAPAAAPDWVVFAPYFIQK